MGHSFYIPCFYLFLLREDRLQPQQILEEYGYGAGKGNTALGMMYRALLEENLDGMLIVLQSYLLTVLQCDNTHYEGHCQQLLYVIFSLMGKYVDVEVRTSNGRVDMVMNSGKALYLFELKLNKSAEAAMKQIHLKDYPARFALSGLPVIKVGIHIDMERHTLADWKMEK